MSDQMAPPVQGMLVSSKVLASLLALISLVLISWVATLLMLERVKDRQERTRLQEYRLLMQGVKDTAIYMLDPQGAVVTWNNGAQQLKQYQAEEIIGQNFSQFYPEAERASGKPQLALQEALTSGLFRDFGERLRKDGSTFYAATTIEPIRRADGSLHGFAKITRDITDVKRVEEHLDAALENMQQGLIMLDKDKRLILNNRRVHSLYGQTQDTLRPGMDLTQIIEQTIGLHSQVKDRNQALRSAAVIYDKLLSDFNQRSIVAEAHEGLVHSLAARRLDNGGWVITIEDITERFRSAKRLEYMATHDSLTNLPNRDRFSDLMDEALTRAGTRGDQLLVAILDLDNFKEVNDGYGHSAGDDVLRDVAMRLEKALAGRGSAARLGGDEFAAFVMVENESDIANIAKSLSDALHFSAKLCDRALEGRVECAGSIGLSVYPQDGTCARDLMINADLAMYRAKADPTRSWTRYLPEMDEEVREKRSLQADLRQALERGEFHIVYQVQCAVTDGSILGYEALLRWDHPTLGQIAPADFIPAAEKNGLILPIGEWVMRETCRQAASWAKPYKVAINVSPVQLVQPNLPKIVTEALLNSGLPASRLEIEITESAIISDKLRALHNLRQIKHLGVSVAIDDFGTGYSSLDTLNSFAFDKIKIDRSFLMGIRKDDHSRTIVKAVLGLGRSLNLPVLAEGVETEEDLELLRQENCHEAQGFYFGRPGKIIFNDEGLPVAIPEPPSRDAA